MNNSDKSGAKNKSSQRSNSAGKKLSADKKAEKLLKNSGMFDAYKCR